MRKKEDSPLDNTHAQLTVAATALAFGMPYIDVFSKRRLTSHEIFLRQLSMYLLSTVYNFNLSRVARIFSRDRATVRHACKLIEDQRDSPAFDLAISNLEHFLLKAPFNPAHSARSQEL